MERCWRFSVHRMAMTFSALKNGSPRSVSISITPLIKSGVFESSMDLAARYTCGNKIASRVPLRSSTVRNNMESPLAVRVRWEVCRTPATVTLQPILSTASNIEIEPDAMIFSETGSSGCASRLAPRISNCTLIFCCKLQSSSLESVHPNRLI